MRSAAFSVLDAQTLGSTMLVEMRMQDDKCLQCGAEGHMYKACTRPVWKSQNQAKQWDAKTGAKIEASNPPKAKAAENDADNQNWM
eukprot:1798483-Amphidinium_carterae.1